MAINKIKELRELKRPYMSQWKLANKVGVSQSLITIWERGYKEPTGEQKANIASALRVEVSVIFPKDEPPF